MVPNLNMQVSYIYCVCRAKGCFMKYLFLIIQFWKHVQLCWKIELDISIKEVFY